MKKVITYVRYFLKFLFLFVLGVIGYLLYKHTLIDWFIPLLVAACIAVATLSLYKKWVWMTNTDSKTLNIIYHLIAVGLMSCVLFLGSNFLFADTASTHVEQVLVKSKQIKTRKNSGRLGRRHYSSTGSSSKSYYLNMCFENGKEKQLWVKREVYNATRPGDKRPLKMRQGLFGFPVIMKSTSEKTAQ